MENLCENARNALKSIINQNGIRDFKIDISPASNKGDNFIGSLYRIEVSGVKNGVITKLNLICKVVPANSKHRSNMNVHAGFEKEVMVYETLLEHFKRFQIEKGLAAQHMFTSYALYYSCSSAANGEYLILEDLKAKSFQMFDRRKKLDRAHAQLTMQGLAKFHAISFALKDQRPEEIKPYTKKPDIMLEIFGKKSFLDLCVFGLKQVLEVLEKNGSKYKERVRKIKENCADIIDSCYNGEEDHRIVVHGDSWGNNMMFRYRDGVPVEICFVDWQLQSYASPVIDLSYYFYNSTQKELLNEHYDDLVDSYYYHLCESIRIFGSDPEVLYPYDTFRKELKKFGKYGFIIAGFGLNFMLAKPEDTPDVGEAASIEDDKGIEAYLGFKDEELKSIYETRIMDIVNHAGERDYL